MIHICNDVIAIHLKLIFEQSLKKENLQKSEKKKNLVPFTQKSDKSLVKKFLFYQLTSYYC